jgi:predicted kinase
MLMEAVAHLSSGRGVILDATFQRRTDRDAARLVAKEHKVPVLFAECQCSEADVRQRLGQRAARGESPSDADWNVYLEQRRHYEPFLPAEAADHCALDTAAPIPEATATVERELRKRAR